MIVAYLYLALGLLLMVLLGQFIHRTLSHWLQTRFGSDREGGRSWCQFLMAGYYLLFSGYLLLSLQPQPHRTVGEMFLVVLEQLAPLMLGIGSLMSVIFWLRICRTSKPKANSLL